jgi:hypothetical protein
MLIFVSTNQEIIMSKQRTYSIESLGDNFILQNNDGETLTEVATGNLKEFVRFSSASAIKRAYEANMKEVTKQFKFEAI